MAAIRRSNHPTSIRLYCLQRTTSISGCTSDMKRAVPISVPPKALGASGAFNVVCIHIVSPIQCREWSNSTWICPSRMTRNATTCSVGRPKQLGGGAMKSVKLSPAAREGHPAQHQEAFSHRSGGDVRGTCRSFAACQGILAHGGPTLRLQRPGTLRVRSRQMATFADHRRLPVHQMVPTQRERQLRLATSRTTSTQRRRATPILEWTCHNASTLRKVASRSRIWQKPCVQRLSARLWDPHRFDLHHVWVAQPISDEKAWRDMLSQTSAEDVPEQRRQVSQP